MPLLERGLPNTGAPVHDHTRRLDFGNPVQSHDEIRKKDPCINTEPNHVTIPTKYAGAIGVARRGTHCAGASMDGEMDE
jgi:hypothetical protein